MVQYRPVEFTAEGINYSVPMSQVFADYWYIFIGSALIYLPAVFLGQRFMKNRKPVEGIKGLLFLWNAFLSVLSAYMFYRCFEEGYTINVFRNFSFQEAICRNRHFGTDYGTSWTFAWMGYTKVLELLDTFFLVIRKKEVITLHWFHHLTVLVYVWGAHVFAQTNVYLIFTVMNTFVHILMYAYFAAAAIGYFFPLPHLLTLLQIVQMVVGSYAVYHSKDCPEDQRMYYAGLIMYVSYFILFTKFFLDKYRGTGAQQAKKKTSSSSSSSSTPSKSKKE